MRSIILTVIVIFFTPILLFAAGNSDLKGPEAVAGFMDLNSWDFQKEGSVRLHGEWLFSWKDFVNPGSPMPLYNISNINIPKYWNKHRHNGSILPGIGWASYRLNVLLPDSNTLLAINLKNIHTAYKLYADDKLIASAGKIGTAADSSRPAFKQDIGFFKPENDEVTFTMQISNFQLSEGGFWESIILGDAETIRVNSTKRIAFEMLLISFILAIGIYHLGIFIFRKDDKAALYFSIFCILIAIRSLTTGEIFIHTLFPFLSFSAMMKIEYICFYSALPFFLMYFRSLFPDDTNKVIIQVFQILAILFNIVVIITPPLLFNKTLQIYQTITALGSVYTILILILAAVRKRTNSITLLAGFLVMFMAFINDVLHANEIIHTGLILPAGFFVFIFSQAILILNRTTLAHNTIEEQRNELIQSKDLFERSRTGTILGLAKLAEYRDEDTGKHLERIREFSKIITQKLAEKDEFKNYITQRYIDDIYLSSILHDIGKVAVPDSILLKPGKLDDDEFKQIKKHTIIGGDALLNIESQTDMKTFLTLGKEIAWYHHEKWDGTGYPKGISGSSIPLSARITAVADVYDALTSERPYKTAFSHKKARDIITEGRGSHFDPMIVDIFIELETDFNRIRFEHKER